jgi:hypothetical protein
LPVRDRNYFELAITKQLETAGDAGVYEDRLAAMFVGEGASPNEVSAFWQALRSLVEEGWIRVDEVAGQRVYRRWPKNITAGPTP